MKLILSYVHPSKKFEPKMYESLFKVQVDNSLELGWKPQDILFLTNFDYEYRGITATLLDDEAYYEQKPVNTKLTVVLSAFKKGLLTDPLYWFHDLDAYQQEWITEDELELDRQDLAMCDYGRRPNWAGGSWFFKPSAEDIFEKAYRYMCRYLSKDETAFSYVVNNDEKIYNRVRKLNISYNFLPFNLRSCYRMAIKPIKVTHFNPYEGIRQLKVDSALEFYKGDNKLNIPLVSERVLKLIEKHYDD